MVRISSILIFAIAFCGGACAGEEGGVNAGLAYSRAVCSECHAIRGDDFLSPDPKAPPFAKIADTPGITGAALNVILQTPHRDMPDLIIAPKDRADVMAYVLSLKR